jgi:hypothetical protein
MKNKLRQSDTIYETPKIPKKENKVGRSVADVFSGRFLSREKTIRHIPFVIFLSFLSLCYIANGYFADDQVRKVNHLMNEIKELRTQYIVVKDSLVIKSKQTEVAKALALKQTGIKESIVPPKKILVKSVGSTKD